MLRRILKISGTVDVSKEIVLGRSKYSKQLVKTIKKRQITFLGYVIMRRLRKAGFHRKDTQENKQKTENVFESMSALTGISRPELLEVNRHRIQWRPMI